MRSPRGQTRESLRVQAPAREQLQRSSRAVADRPPGVVPGPAREQLQRSTLLAAGHPAPPPRCIPIAHGVRATRKPVDDAKSDAVMSSRCNARQKLSSMSK